MGARRRFRLPVARGARGRYLAAAVVLTLVWLLARSLAPAGGLTRSYYHPLPAGVGPRVLSQGVPALAPVFADTSATVDLAFLEQLGRPTRHYYVRWSGVWYSPRAERIELQAGADDGVIVRVDGQVFGVNHSGRSCCLI